MLEKARKGLLEYGCWGNGRSDLLWLWLEEVFVVVPFQTWGHRLMAQRVKNLSACNAGDLRSIPGLGWFPGEGNGYLLQYSCLKNSMDRGAWWATSPWGCKQLDKAEWLIFFFPDTEILPQRNQDWHSRHLHSGTCWWEYKMVQLLWKTVWRVLKKWKNMVI